MERVRIEKLVHGGQGLGTLNDGRRVFVWNALPDELVLARIIKKKRSYAEAIAEEILEVSPLRQVPHEANYLATSPWQILDQTAENGFKSDIVRELFAQEHVTLPSQDFKTTFTGSEWFYRNKMEYSFWGDDDGVHLALHQRGSSGKHIVTGSELALPAVDAAARAVLEIVRGFGLRAGELKTVIVRASQSGAAAASLFIKGESFPAMTRIPEALQGLRIYHSNPKSPASVPTALLAEYGNVILQDKLLDKQFEYDVDSFFQVNLPIFEHALTDIRAHVNQDPVDMYAGVGSIGLSVARHDVTLVELDHATVTMARENFAASGLSGVVIEASTETVLDNIVADRLVIVDPPRAGLHPKVVSRILEVQPPKLIYLSCNPATHARDLALLQEHYEITDFKVYNFFPKTPHIETLAVLKHR